MSCAELTHWNQGHLDGLHRGAPVIKNSDDRFAASVKPPIGAALDHEWINHLVWTKLSHKHVACACHWKPCFSFLICLLGLLQSMHPQNNHDNNITIHQIIINYSSICYSTIGHHTPRSSLARALSALPTTSHSNHLWRSTRSCSYSKYRSIYLPDIFLAWLINGKSTLIHPQNSWWPLTSYCKKVVVHQYLQSTRPLVITNNYHYDKKNPWRLLVVTPHQRAKKNQVVSNFSLISQ